MKLSTVTNLVQKYGARGATHILSYRALEKAFRYKALVGCITRAQQLSYPEDVSFPEGYTGGFLTFDELRHHSKTPANDMDEAFLSEAEARGDRCYGIIEDGVLASYGWYTNTPFDINPHVTLHFDRDYWFVYKCLTQPEHRGKRLHGIGMAKAIYQLSDENYAGIVAYVESRNYPSLRSGRKMGHTEFGIIRFGKVAGHYRSWATPGCKPYNFFVTTR